MGEPAPQRGPFPRHVVSKAPAGTEKSLWFGSQQKGIALREGRKNPRCCSHPQHLASFSRASMRRKTGVSRETLSNRCTVWKQPTANLMSPLHSQKTEMSSHF